MALQVLLSNMTQALPSITLPPKSKQRFSIHWLDNAVWLHFLCEVKGRQDDFRERDRSTSLLAISALCARKANTLNVHHVCSSEHIAPRSEEDR